MNPDILIHMPLTYTSTHPQLFYINPPVFYVTFFFTLWGGECIIPNHVSLSNQLFINYSIQCTNFWHQATKFLLLFFLNHVYQQKYFWATQDFSLIYCSVNIQGDESYYPSWHTTFCTVCPRPFSFTIYYSGENFPTQFQALSVSHNLQIIFLGRFLPQEAYLLLFFKQKSEDTVRLIANAPGSNTSGFTQFLKGQIKRPVHCKFVVHFLLGIKQINKTVKVHTQHTNCSTFALLSALDIQYT
jgi:hypothetical protein